MSWNVELIFIQFQLYEAEKEVLQNHKRDLEMALKEKERLKLLMADKEEEVFDVRRTLEHERTKRIEAERTLRDLQSEIKVCSTM